MAAGRLCKEQGCDRLRFNLYTRCFKHIKEREKQKREDKNAKRLERKLSSKKHQVSETKKWHRKAWKLMSEYIRRWGSPNGEHNACYTCHNTFPWKELHAGHYQHGTLDFDGRNLKPQCASCNTYHGGRLDIYTLRLIEENGKEWVDKLRRDAAQHPGYRLDELKTIYAQLQQKLESLK